MSKPSDDEIIQVLTEHGDCKTYQVAYWLRLKYRLLDTAYVLRRLKRLERAGKVHRVKSSYMTQICWEATHD